MAGRPQYIHSGGNVLMRTPLQLKNSRMVGFFIKGSLQNLQNTVDATLNAASAGRMRFKVLSPLVMLTFTRVSHANSAHPDDHEKGWGQETDIVTWIMVGGIPAGSDRVDHVYAYPCHIWVDDCMALINGRELYGYPKFDCLLTMPASGEAPRRFAIAVKAFESHSAASQMTSHTLIEVDAVATQAADVPVLGSLGELAKRVLEMVNAHGGITDLSASGWAHLFSTALSPRMDQVFLKQFPDGTGTKAVYQAVVAAEAVVTKTRHARLLGSDFKCTIHRSASFPLDETLGLTLGEQPVLLAFELDFCFEVGAARELVDNSVVQTRKVAILGGGVSAITAAYHLTDQPGWQDRYDITVYQMGWRLGGKGASGRNPHAGQRIEEHGLHIWFGFYDNAFELMQKVYAALGRPAGSPLATWEDAFKPQHFIALSEWVDGQWKTWLMNTPAKPGVPGEGNQSVSIWDMAVTGYEWMKLWLDDVHADLERLSQGKPVPLVRVAAGHLDLLRRAASGAQRHFSSVAGDARTLLGSTFDLMLGLRGAGPIGNPVLRLLLKQSLLELRAWLHSNVLPEVHKSDDLRRGFISLDLAWTILIGMLEDRVFERGFDAINDIDLRAWLAKHGANPVHTLDCAPLRGYYDLVLAYEDGDTNRPNAEAGTMLRGILRITFAYRGAIMWKMQGGMGDVVFTPLYEVLKKRGVKFEFFHTVEELVPTPDGSEVGEIRMTQQARLRDGLAEYDPLVDVKGMGCWPSVPNYEQLDPAYAEALQEFDINLESNWSRWPQIHAERFGQELPERRLQLGRDFDLVVFGISLGSVPELCPGLLAVSPAMTQMCANVKTVSTQAYQVWTDKSLSDMGWKHQTRIDDQPVLTAFTKPFDTWAPMDHLLSYEAWPPQHEPKNVSYFCSVLPVQSYPPYSDHEFPQRCTESVRKSAIEHLKTGIPALWPAIARPGAFDWERLVDTEGRTGENRFDGQYWRANIDPSERYVMSVVGSTAYRLPTDGSGFSNLYLTGDWIRTGINAGCVEAAVMAGMQTSRAISGWPKVVKGEHELWSDKNVVPPLAKTGNPGADLPNAPAAALGVLKALPRLLAGGAVASLGALAGRKRTEQ